jgi:hypothetical protein
MMIMMLSQEQLLFPTEAVPPAGPLPAGAETLRLQSGDGETLHGVHLRPDDGSKGDRTLILGFGGNAWNAQEAGEYLHHVFPEADVVVFHYRGYRPSTGKPSAEALLADAPRILDFAEKRLRPQQTVAIGFSIGSGVAASLAGSGKLNGMILITPFDSLKAVAAELYPWLPIGPFFRHELDAAGYLAGSDVPVALIAAERDEIIPAARTQALRAKVPNLAYDRAIHGAGHNDIYWRGDFQNAVREAMNAVVTK